LKRHNSGSGGNTTSGGTWKLVYYEAFLSRKDVMARGYKLKHDGRSRRFIYERAANSLTGQK